MYIYEFNSEHTQKFISADDDDDDDIIIIAIINCDWIRRNSRSTFFFWLCCCKVKKKIENFTPEFFSYDNFSQLLFVEFLMVL